VLEREGLKNAEVVGDYIMERIAEWPEKLDLVGDVRGRGLMIGIEIVTDKKERTPGATERDLIVERAFERGVLFLGCGPNTIRLAPPLIVSKEQADIALDVLEECIKVVAIDQRHGYISTSEKPVSK
jgi:4-aminobutyrate aminotransferase